MSNECNPVQRADAALSFCEGLTTEQLQAGLKAMDILRALRDLTHSMDGFPGAGDEMAEFALEHGLDSEGLQNRARRQARATLDVLDGRFALSDLYPIDPCP